MNKWGKTFAPMALMVLSCGFAAAQSSGQNSARQKAIADLKEVAYAGNVNAQVQLGVIYLTGVYQVAVEAIVPMNGASGRGVGVFAQLDLYLDDLLPNSLGKPIFVGSR